MGVLGHVIGDNMRFYLQASRILATLSTALAGLALLLATIGIYGTVASW